MAGSPLGVLRSTEEAKDRLRELGRETADRKCSSLAPVLWCGALAAGGFWLGRMLRGRRDPTPSGPWRGLAGRVVLAAAPLLVSHLVTKLFVGRASSKNTPSGRAG